MIEHLKFMGSANVAGLEPHGEMLFREISPSWTLDGQLKKRNVAAQDRTIWKIFSSRAASADNA